MEQRPDVREYTALLHEATAQVGVATANMLPQITLTGSYGGEATALLRRVLASSAVWSLVGSLTQPIFKGGQLLHQRRAAVAAAQAGGGQLPGHRAHRLPERVEHPARPAGRRRALAARGQAERAAADSLELVQAQYKSGAASYTQVLTAEQTYQDAAVALVKARAQRFADTAALFQALGGGWWNRDDVNANSNECCKGSM